MEEAFREVHSLKGAARAVAAGELESLCQEMETVFAGLKEDRLQLERELLDLLFLAADLATDRVREVGREAPAEIATLLAEATRRLGEAAQGRRAAPPPFVRSAEAPPAGPEGDTLRVGAGRLAEVLVQAEELHTDRVAARLQLDRLRDLLAGLERLDRRLALAGAAGRELRRDRAGAGGREERSLLRLRELLAEDRQAAAVLEDEARQLLRHGASHYRSLEMKVDTLLAAVRETLMLPVANLLEQLPRVVRDLSRESGKGADLELTGGEVPIDRRILEELRDPLLHLLRNTIDHGLEPAEERGRQGKPERGRIRLAVTTPAPGRVLFTLSDDGRGLDTGKLKEAAVRGGLLSPEQAEALDDWQAAELSFASGISTTGKITTVSGRGLGLAIVREKVERLGGEVRVRSRPGEGTEFQLEIPAVLAAFRGILVRLGEARFIFPATAVERVLRTSREHIAVMENREVIELAGETLPVVRLEQPLGLPLRLRSGEEALTLVLTAAPRGKAAFAVDEVVAEREFLVKGLGKQLVKVTNYSGAALLGDGGIALILDPDELLRNAARPAPAAAPAAAEPGAGRRRVLVVEDSITARTLLRNILEGAGYAVVTAVDGAEALQRLASAVFDVVVSDVEMPRLDGFQLTRRIREDYGRLPVILVTGLERPEERARGLDAGADAYLVKSRFDQGNLLEILGRLL